MDTYSTPAFNSNSSLYENAEFETMTEKEEMQDTINYLEGKLKRIAAKFNGNLSVNDIKEIELLVAPFKKSA